MSYIVLKSDNRNEIRLYPESNEFEGTIVYKGHKLGVELNLLSQIIDFRYEKSSNRMLFLKYDKIKEKISLLDRDIWVTSSSESFDKEIINSWETAQSAMENKVGKFRKILITIVYI